MDSRFQHSREAQFLNGILDSMNNKDFELFSKSLESYEQIATVSAWERHFIDKIKIHLSSFASADTIFNRKSVAAEEDEFPDYCGEGGGDVDLM